jgi:hypothetical protein
MLAGSTQMRGDMAALGRGCTLAYLSSGIYDLGGIVLTLDPDHLAEGVLDGGVVALDKVAIDELYGKRGFACAPKKKIVAMSAFVIFAPPRPGRTFRNGDGAGKTELVVFVCVFTDRLIGCRQWRLFSALKAQAFKQRDRGLVFRGWQGVGAWGVPDPGGRRGTWERRAAVRQVWQRVLTAYIQGRINIIE